MEKNNQESTPGAGVKRSGDSVAVVDSPDYSKYEGEVAAETEGAVAIHI